MANKMSKNKQKFMSGIKVKIQDFTDPNYKPGRFYVKLDHFKEAIWLLRKFIDAKNVKVKYLDGNYKAHLYCCLDIMKGGEYKGTLFLSNFSPISFTANQETTWFGSKNRPKVKEFFISIREVKDYIKTL